MFDYTLHEQSANELYDILVEHIGAKDDRHERNEFLEQFVNKGIPEPHTFTGVADTTWDLWLDPNVATFLITPNSSGTATKNNVNLQEINALLNSGMGWYFIPVGL